MPLILVFKQMSTQDHWKERIFLQQEIKHVTQKDVLVLFVSYINKGRLVLASLILNIARLTTFALGSQT